MDSHHIQNKGWDYFLKLWGIWQYIPHNHVVLNVTNFLTGLYSPCVFIAQTLFLGPFCSIVGSNAALDAVGSSWLMLDKWMLQPAIEAKRVGQIFF